MAAGFALRCERLNVPQVLITKMPMNAVEILVYSEISLAKPARNGAATSNTKQGACRATLRDTLP